MPELVPEAIALAELLERFSQSLLAASPCEREAALAIIEEGIVTFGLVWLDQNASLAKQGLSRS
jgi:hypothetical protein